MKRVFQALVAAIVILIPNLSHAYVGLCCSKCGGNMPLVIPGAGVPETCEFRFKLTPSFMKMDGMFIGDSTVETNSLLGMPMMNGMPTGKFMAAPTSMDMSMLSASAGYSFTEDFFAGLMLMYNDNDMKMRFNSMMQGMTGREGFTMKSEGLADTMLMSKYLLYADDKLVPTSQVSLFFGASLPTGSIDEKNSEHPLAMRRAEQLPYGMQLGSGTLDPILGLVYSGSSSPYWWGANALYTGRWYENDRDYRLGDEVRVDLYAMYQARYDLVFELQLNGKHWGSIQGEMDDAANGSAGRVVSGNPNSPYATPLWDPDNYGGTKLAVTAGVQWQPLPLSIDELSVGVPLYQHLDGPQLGEDYRVMLTFYLELPTPGSRRFDRGGATNEESKLGFES